jgi:hypothetical protein
LIDSPGWLILGSQQVDQRERIMSLQGSISDLQAKLEKFYLELEQRFNENQIIRDLWNAMAHDIAQQKRSMTMLPHSFWNKLKEEQDGFTKSISAILLQNIDNKEDESLASYFNRALLFEEPTISKIYVPIIRKLRGNWTDQALDFYIMVKAHLARITRVTLAFSGNPVIIQRSSSLLQHFEKEVQEPQVTAKDTAHKGFAAQPIQREEKHVEKSKKKTRTKPAPALVKRAPSHRTRTKPLAKKTSLQRRRVRR